ncbi:MAG: hypothetical protein R3270_00405 [Gammaproteobacteria bacterium]|nr:hypothetical protein [Gammaproteobacteria bacterium]
MAVANARSLLLAFAACCIPAVASSNPTAFHVYEVSVDAALTQLSVRACFADGLPDQLRADHTIAARATTEMRLKLNGRPVSFAPRGNVANFRRPSDDGCIEWDTDLDEIAGLDRMTSGYRAGESLLLDPRSWLWRPWRMSANRDIEIRFTLPPGVSVSVPWQAVDGAHPASRFRFGQGPFDWPALMAIGRLQHDRIDVPGATLRLSMVDGPAKGNLDTAARWLKPAGLAVASLDGRFPRRTPQVLVVPLDGGRDAAPWAQVNRGGGAAAHFFMNSRADWSVFADDWIAAHELAHMSLPFVRRSDAWLSEGFASYYQNILRARIGLLGERQAWQKLHDGFRRGEKNTAGGTLREVTRSRQQRAWMMRIYWTGAAIALLADVELRERTNGEWSLDKVIAGLQECCLDEPRAWTARELFAEFDRLSNTDVFATLHEQTVHSRHFPAVRDLYERLGIRVDDQDRITLDDSAGLARLRQQIVTAPETKEAALSAASE